MAQQIPCDICQRTTADFIITAIANGDTLGVGIECVAAWAEQLTAAYDAAQAAQAPPGGPLDGMPDRPAVEELARTYGVAEPAQGAQEVTPMRCAHGRTDAERCLDCEAEDTDEAWEASGARGGRRGRPEGPTEGAEDQLPAPASEVAADVDV